MRQYRRHQWFVEPPRPAASAHLRRARDAIGVFGIALANPFYNRLIEALEHLEYHGRSPPMRDHPVDHAALQPMMVFIAVHLPKQYKVGPLQPLKQSGGRDKASGRRI